MPKLELLDDGWCFACGKNNPKGLHLEFTEKDGLYITKFTPGKEHQGYMGITHGGIIAALLDEVMARFAWSAGRKVVTAEMSIKLRLPAKTGEELTVVGKIKKEDRKTVSCEAEARNPEGQVVAQASARMVKI